ncbi:MAG: reverse transcriptase family protein, partial [Candidatus Thiodiazotropha sp.]
PVFKKKGNKTEAKNYRGITVIPVLTKILELVLRERIKPFILEHQNNLQRGFTEHSSPLMAALILEEFIRDRKDSKTPVHIAFLDAKSAFDVVSHDSLMRKLFHIGVEGTTWSVINSLHRDAQSAVKWFGQVSDKFHVQQGVRQGGILSADLYKVYNNKLLDRLTSAGTDTRIGNICCVAPTCADDIAIASDSKILLQSLVDIAVDYSQMELFLLQPAKSVVLDIPNGSRKRDSTSLTDLVMGGEIMPTVDNTTHVGICRSSDSDESTVIENVKKARRTLYSLMPAGMHGENGLDPESSLHLYQIYVIPILLYGLEVVLPRPKIVDIADKFNKKYLKCLLSVPITTADAAVYILSGTIPIQGMIEQRILGFFGSICRLPCTSVEKQLAERQLTAKPLNSNSWFIAVKKLLIKYNLPDPFELLENPPSKYTWKRRVRDAINGYWIPAIQAQAALYPSLRWLNVRSYEPGSLHPLVRLTGDLREVPRLAVKLKLVTGTYILQTTRAAFNQNPIKPTCLVCNISDETPQHFLLNCSSMSHIREPILNQITKL